MSRPTYHQSELGQFLKCGLAWEFRYVKGYRPAPRAALTVGTAVDRSVNANMLKKAQSQIVVLDEVLAVASDEFEKARTETAWLPDEDPGEHKDQALSLARLHFEKAAPLIQPKTVQEEFVIELDGDFDVAGAIDLTDQNGFVRDTKTSARQSSGNYVIERAFQPAMYTFAYTAIHGSAPAGFVFDILKKPTTKIPAEYEARAGQVTQRDQEWLFSSIQAVHKGITAGVALPAPEGAWWCSTKFCGFWNICKGKQ
jgi:hypothetical protein